MLGSGDTDEHDGAAGGGLPHSQSIWQHFRFSSELGFALPSEETGRPSSARTLLGRGPPVSPRGPPLLLWTSWGTAERHGKPPGTPGVICALQPLWLLVPAVGKP